MKDDSWHVKTVQRGLNMTISQASGVTPSELLFGTKLRSVPESIREKAKAGFDTEQSEQKQRFDTRTVQSIEGMHNSFVNVAKILHVEVKHMKSEE
jgi:hypothetical protein